MENKSSIKHPDYLSRISEWEKIRDCMIGEKAIKDKEEVYLPRPAGMSGRYAASYDGYIERAHFPLICPYALSGALGVVINKIPEFNLPKKFEYLTKHATIDGRSLKQFFIDIVIEIFETGRVPIIVTSSKTNQFKFVQYKAEQFINWKTAVNETEKNLTLGVFQEQSHDDETSFSHSTSETFRVLYMKEGVFHSILYDKDDKEREQEMTPTYMGKTINEIPLFVAGSINNSFDLQPIPLISVANCSIQIYRKEADLANSEFLSCNPTLVVVGASEKDSLPNVVGSSVMMVIPNEQARVFYTETDTEALNHVKEHIKDLYEEAIRHGVAILDNRKGVEAAEALRIRQATQSASIFSIYLSAVNVIMSGIRLMCRWAGIDEDELSVDAPSSLTFGVPDSGILKEIITGFSESGVVPLAVVHKYLVSSGLIDQTVGYEDYIELIEENMVLRQKLGLIEYKPNEEKNEEEGFVESETDKDGNPIKRKKIKKSSKKDLNISEKTIDETSGSGNK